MWPLSLVIEEVSIVWAKLNLLISALMGLSAALQYNDPDPLPWIAFYACAAFAGFTHNGRMGAFFCLGLAAIGAGWASHLAQNHLDLLDFAKITQSMQAESPGIELGREIGGLSFASAWLAALGIGQWMRRRELLRVQKRHRVLSHPTKDPSDPSATDPDSPPPASGS